MIDGPFREQLPRFCTPLIAAYQRLGLTPNAVTTMGFICAVVAAVLVATDMPWGGLMIWWLGRIFDGTDGILARATNRVSLFGGYLDIVLDMASYGIMILAFALWQPHLMAAWLIIMFLYVLCITSALALGGIERGNHRDTIDNRTLRLAAGLAEGGETGIAYTLFLLCPGLLEPLTFIWILILATTVVSRSLLAYRSLGRS